MTSPFHPNVGNLATRHGYVYNHHAGYFPATAPAPEDLQDQQLQAYLQSFSPEPPQAVEPGWAKAIRLLEAAPVSRRSSEPVQATARATEAVKA